ncbi:helix-turn-helix domain-containing protein [Enterobacter cloacae]|nr:helix-turn-helix domain-containing protein [Enterobacter cloacae]
MASGVKFGRKPHRQSDMVRELITQDAPEKTILEKTGVSRATFYRMKKRTRIEQIGVIREKTKR